MRRFNPEKELSKIKSGNKNKIIVGLCALLLIVVVGYSFALYQVRNTNKLVYTTVKDFKKRDIYLSVLVDGITQNDFPKNNEGKIYSGIECDKEYSEAYFDNTEWKLHFTSDGPNKCTVKFETGNLPNPPELYQGMIPVVFSDTGIMYVADTNSDWYNYQDHRWANAVLVDASNSTIKAKYFDSNNKLRTDIVGKEVPMEEVLQMYVWIPRYKYQLFNADNNVISPQEIKIIFEKDTSSMGEVNCIIADNGKENCTNAINGKWYTHPAFKFGNTDLKGIWVGKFEPSDPNDPNGRKTNGIDEITILPDKTSMTYKNVADSFNAIRDIEKKYAVKYNINTQKIDTHMMKNIEWGAVAYLTNSKYGRYDGNGNPIESGAEVWINNTAQGAGHVNVTYAYGGTATGCVGDSVSAAADWKKQDDASPAMCPDGRKWNQSGVKASTTGNMYGIYDMAGGTWDYVMGVITNDSGSEPYYARSGFTKENMVDTKYYDIYEFSGDIFEYERGHLGDATRETMISFGQRLRGWYNDVAEFPYVTDILYPWFWRGGRYIDGAGAGLFAFSSIAGHATWNSSFRVVLTAQDGVE